ncbi:hypothetical protein CG724_11715 [Streptomyces sp. CB02120-2]|nr:hypothetical protein CG724_11715 [Streptomyces sp. CB02120-2]
MAFTPLHGLHRGGPGPAEPRARSCAVHQELTQYGVEQTGGARIRRRFQPAADTVLSGAAAIEKLRASKISARTRASAGGICGRMTASFTSRDADATYGSAASLVVQRLEMLARQNRNRGMRPARTK